MPLFSFSSAASASTHDTITTHRGFGLLHLMNPDLVRRAMIKHSGHRYWAAYLWKTHPVAAYRAALVEPGPSLVESQHTRSKLGIAPTRLRGWKVCLHRLTALGVSVASPCAASKRAFVCLQPTSPETNPGACSLCFSPCRKEANALFDDITTLAKGRLPARRSPHESQI